MYRFLIIIFLLLTIVMLQSSCSPNSEGFYSEIKGECRVSLYLKKLSPEKYVLIMKNNSGEENEVFGRIEENVIFGKIGEEPAYFVLNKNRILMIYQDNKCIFEKDE